MSEIYHAPVRFKKYFSPSLLLLAGIALTGSILLLIATAPWGIGVSRDGVRYIGGARSILQGHGYVNHINLEPITQWPPLFPFALAVIGLLGIDPVEGARILHVVLFGLNILVAGLIIQKFTKSSIFALIGTGLMLVSYTVIESHCLVRSEPLFIFLVFIGFFFLLEYFATGFRRFLFAAGGFTALACLDRYAGVSVIAASVLAILLFHPKNIRLRIIDTLVYGTISSLPLCLWLLRNHLAADKLTNRDLVFRPTDSSYFLQALNTFSSWILPLHTSPFLRYSVLTLFLVFFAAIFMWVIYRENQNKSREAGSTDAFLRVMGLMILFSVCVVGLELFHLTFLYAHVQASDRHFLPIFVAGLISSLILTHHFLELYPHHHWLKLIAAALLIFVGFSYLQSSSQYILSTYKEGRRYTTRTWRKSPTVAKAAALPADVLIYSNDPGALYILTNRKTYTLPRKYDRRYFRDKKSATLDTKFMRRIERTRKKLISQNGYIVFFHQKHRWHTLTEPELQQYYPLRLLDQFPDGSIYQIKIPENLTAAQGRPS